ncbi:hypothetical protein BD780_000607 [Clostridium tetanomorphum]|nr:hypothetical protein [Clostridium tetanomorphum]
MKKTSILKIVSVTIIIILLGSFCTFSMKVKSLTIKY